MISSLIEAGQEKFGRAIDKAKMAIELRFANQGECSLPYAEALETLALVYMEQKQCQDAKPLLIKALEIKFEHLDLFHPLMILNFNELARIFLFEGKTSEAIEKLEMAQKTREQSAAEDNLDSARTYLYLGYAYAEKRETEKARDFIEKSLAIIKPVSGEKHSLYAECQLARCYTYLLENNIKKTYEALSNASKDLQKEDTKYSALSEIFYLQCFLLSQSSKSMAAINTLEGNISNINPNDSNMIPFLARANFCLGFSYYLNKDYPKAMAIFETLLEQCKSHCRSKNFFSAMINFAIGKTFQVVEKADLAIQFYEETLNIMDTLWT